MPFDTPQDAEDAFYDALEAGDPAAMTQVWEDSESIACLLPMTPLVMGPEVLQLWRSIFEQAGAFDIQVRHLAWIEAGETAVHLIEERMQGGAPGQPGPAIYGTNVFRKGADGWRLLIHQNSPTPQAPSAPGA
ncbi:MAG: nuclear transport factor 2 family protein [Thiocapsa sp.]|uniref:YybH family protein n=1 Tax=Thiocapsa sp. TaxID=2024551 RepID=UPI001BD162AE|nr:nuclear transport factor 2 family protein [Thiocapsa sp.]QVL46686.1 MAG: nuclear transport factor 2 family protein [Thiocapsa sp.]